MSESEELKAISADEIAQHNTANDLWVVYNGRVYDVSHYIDEHPGGEEVVVDVAGTDATEAFDDIGHSEDAHEILSGLVIGKLEGGIIKDTNVRVDMTEESGLSLPLVGAVVFALAAAAYFYLNA